MNIHKIWGLLTDDVYDDILLLELDKSLPYIINDKEHYEVAVIEMILFLVIQSKVDI